MQMINRILLIDDDEITNYLHKDLIDQMAIANEVVTLGNAEEALTYIAHSSQNYPPKNKQTKIILLDINMPVIDGFEFLEAFKARHLPDHFKIFMVSSSQNPRDIQKANDHQVYGYVSKPLTEQKVLAIMENTKQEDSSGCLC
jgi:CheY-like chemotaxis protein